MNPDPHPTAELVSAEELIKLAELGRSLRRAQEAFFAAKRANPMDPAREQLAAARDYERRFDARLREILAEKRGPSLF